MGEAKEVSAPASLSPAQNAVGGQEHLVHSIEENSEGKSHMKKNVQLVTFGIWAVCIAVGVGTGYFLSQKLAGAAPGQAASGFVQTEKTVGSTDTKTFKDSAEGMLEKGGAGGEGTHQLIREGGPSQTAHLTSSVVDLDEYVGKKVKVWGQTMGAKRVAWLMDVGKIELME